MNRMITTALASALMLLPLPAAADYFVWRDAQTGMTMSFPDTWRMVSVQKPDERLRIMAPDPANIPFCLVRSYEDKRFAGYPVRYADEIQALHYSREFWNRYGGEYNNVQLHTVQDGGLGRGTGSVALASYTAPAIDGGGQDVRTGLMIAALYYDRAYVLDCSVKTTAFNDWRGAFLSIAKSIDFKKANHELRNGNYRDFTQDPGLTFPDLPRETTQRR